jgi:hypothetical protein
MKFARWYLLQSGSVKAVIHTPHCGVDCRPIPNVANIKPQFPATIPLSHIILFFFVAAKYANFPNVGLKEAPKDCISKRSGPSGD